jgi:predicted nucleic acid-binding protein
MPARFIDTNVLLRYFTRDDEKQAPQALALLRRVERGEERIQTSPIVIFETVFILDRTYGMPRSSIHSLVKPVLELSGLSVPGKSLLLAALDRFAVASRKLSFADLYIALDAQSRGITEIYTWDKGFDRIEGITRVEPGSDLT